MGNQSAQINLSLQALVLAIALVGNLGCGKAFKLDGGHVTTGLALVSAEEDLLTKGIAQYAVNCAACHGDYAVSAKKGRSFGDISLAIGSVGQMNLLKSMRKQDLENIAYALTFKAAAPTTPTSEIDQPPILANSWEKLEAKSCAPVGVARDIRILDPSQYKDIVLDLFGYTADITTLPAINNDYYTPGATSSGSGVEDLLHVEALYGLAEKVATHTSDNFAAVTARFSNCVQTAKACQDQISTAILSRLLRKNLDNSDADFVAIMNQFAGIADFRARLKSVIMAGLMNPRFMYQVEYKAGFRGQGLAQDTLRSIDDHELASRMSFMLWNSVPDQELLNLAAQKKLSQIETQSAQIKRMLADPRSQRFAKKFTSEWLNISALETISKDASLVPGFNVNLMKRFKIETETFASVQFAAKKDFREFFTADTTYTDATLAGHYGITGVQGTAFVASRRPQSELHGGILAHGSVSAISSSSTTDPIHRGNYEFQRFLCGQLGKPPAGAALVVIEGSKYEQMIGRKQMQSCASCHAKFEGIGYVSERLNPLGQFRTADEAGAITGQSVQLENGVFVKSIQDLGQEMAGNPLLGYCLSQNLAKYALRGSYQSTDSVKCQTENNVYQAYKSGNSMQAYVENLILSPLFSRKMETR